MTGKYCNNCGQPASTHPLNFHFLWHDIQHGLFHVDKGILFTLKELFTRPGYTIKEYVHGKRARHFKPISLVLVLAGIFGLLYHYFEINAMPITKVSQNVDFQKINDWIGSHMALTQLIQLPIFSLASWLAFKKANTIL